MVKGKMTFANGIVILQILLLAAVAMGSPLDKLPFRFPLKREAGMTNYEFATYLIRNADLDSNGKMSQSELSTFYRVFIKVDKSTSEFVGQKLIEYGDVFTEDGELDFMELLLALERVYE